MRLAPGLHRIGSDFVNCYLVEDRAGVTIIDAGLPGHWRELEAELSELGRSLDDVRGIVLTHGDTDHIGFAERLRQRAGIPVYVHELDAARARGEIKKPNSGWGHIKVRPLLGFLWYSGRRGGLRIRPVAEVVTFTDGATLDLPGSPQIIHMPGHTPGSVAVHVPTVDAVFVGDTMTTRDVLTGEVVDDPRPSRSSRRRLVRLSQVWRPYRRPGCYPVTGRRGTVGSPTHSRSFDGLSLVSDERRPSRDLPYDHVVDRELEEAVVVEFPLRGERWVAVTTPGDRIPSHGVNMLGQRYAYDLLKVDGRKGVHYHPAGLLRDLLIGGAQLAHGQLLIRQNVDD